MIVSLGIFVVGLAFTSGVGLAAAMLCDWALSEIISPDALINTQRACFAVLFLPGFYISLVTAGLAYRRLGRELQ